MIKIKSVINMTIDGNEALIVSKVSDNKLLLNSMDIEKGTFTTIARFKGSKCLLIERMNEKIFIGVDNKLLIGDYGNERNWKEVLTTKNICNAFRCLVSAKEYLYCIEYGEPLTGLYRSEDGYSWKLIATAQDIDRKARHFHCLAYDKYRDILIVTLGDNCRAKAGFSYDGKSFEIAKTGPAQLLPITCTKEYIVFGTDDPVYTGLVIYEPKLRKSKFIPIKMNKCVPAKSRSTIRKLLFLKPCPSFMSDLKILNGRFWVATFAIPQIAIASRDMRIWYPIIERSYLPDFYWTTINEGERYIAFTLGEDSFIIDKSRIENLLNEKSPIAYKHRAIRERILSFAYFMRAHFSV
jgi:hypothetical protein